MAAKIFLLALSNIQASAATLKTDEAKAIVDMANELSESYADLAHAVRGTAREAKAAKQLWRGGRKPVLIKVGLALIAFPDPTISDVVGTFLVAAGVVQEGIRRRTLYVDDAYKTFQNTMKEIRAAKDYI